MEGARLASDIGGDYFDVPITDTVWAAHGGYVNSNEVGYFVTVKSLKKAGVRDIFSSPKNEGIGKNQGAQSDVIIGRGISPRHLYVLVRACYVRLSIGSLPLTNYDRRSTRRILACRKTSLTPSYEYVCFKVLNITIFPVMQMKKIPSISVPKTRQCVNSKNKA